MNTHRTYSPTARTVLRLPVPSMERDVSVIVCGCRCRHASVLVCGSLQRARGADEEMSVADGDDFRNVLFYAVDDAVVAKKDLANVPASDFPYDAAGKREFLKTGNGFEYVIFPFPRRRPVAALLRAAQVRACCRRSGMDRLWSLEQVGMGAGAGQFKYEDVLVKLVDEKPVGRDMAFTMIGPVADKRMVVVFGRQFLAVGELADDGLKLLDWQMPSQHQLVVALECGCVTDDIRHFARTFQSLSRSVYEGWVGSFAMRSPSSIAAMVSALGSGSAEMTKGMRFSRITVFMYTVSTDDAESPTLSQKSTKRFFVGASSEIVMFAMVFILSFAVKTSVSYTKFTGHVKRAA